MRTSSKGCKKIKSEGERMVTMSSPLKNKGQKEILVIIKMF